MRITFLAPHAGLSGGIRVIAMHALGLQKRGHQVSVISQPLPRPSFKTRVRMALHGQFVQHAEGPGHLHGVPVEHRVLDRPGPVTDADAPDADVVVATWWETAEWAAKLSPRKGIKTYLIQGDETCFYTNNADQERVAATWRLPLRKMAVSRWLVELGRTRCPGHEVTIIPNAVDTAMFNAPARDKQPVPMVGMVSSPFPGKGTGTVLRAFQIARERTRQLRLVAFGDPPAADVPGWPQDCQLEVRPRQDRIPQLYASCDAWLFGSEREGFGLPVLEAMACRTPVVGTHAGAAPELLAPGGGMLVNWGDAEGMAAAITRIVGMTPVEWRAMSDTAHRTALAYAWEPAVARLETFLQTAAASKSP